MAALKIWRFAFVTKSVMGFVASSLNLATGHARAEDAHLPDQKRTGPSHRAWDRQRGQQRFARPVQRTRSEVRLTERRQHDRGMDALNITGPVTWRRRHSSARNITEYHTRNLQAGVASFVVPPPVDFVGTTDEFQSGLLRSISESMPVVEGTTKTGTAGSFQFLSCVMKPTWGAPRHVVLYTALWAGKGQVLLFGADCDQLFHDNVLVAHALVQKIVVPVSRPC